jgi:transcriptional regulator with XRE-family HTH domain
VATRIDQERVRILLEKIGLNDRQIGERIGVDQSTIWRLRNGRTSKVSRYIGRLEALVREPTASDGFESLEALADQSPAFRAVLEALMQFMHEQRDPIVPRPGG